MRLPLLFAGLVLNVLLSGVHGVRADTPSPPCDVSDHLHTCLCSYPEYHVRRMRRSLWVSTTVWDLSPSSGRARALKKLQRYLHGHNNQGVTIPMEWPLTTQTYVPTGFLREVTVALPLPQEEWISPPVPEDPTVVLDVVPETVLYVKSFRRRGDLGFSAQREAQKLLHLLIANKEPIVRRDDYYYILQHGGDGSTLRERYEVAIFATNAVLDEFYRGTDGPGERLLRLPRCLRGNDSLWSSGGASIHADLVRRDCGTTFCYGPDCPAYTIQSNDDRGVERRSYRTVGPLMRADPFMCQFDRARQQGQKIMFQKLKEAGLVSPGRNFSRFSPVVTAVVQVGPKGCSCSRTYTSYMPVPRDVLTRESFGSTCQDLSGYVLCFGGHGGAETAFEAGRRLNTALTDRGASFSDDAMAVVEYNVQSRVFDRHNEVFMETRDSENRCLHTDTLDTHGQHSLDFTLHKDWFEDADITSPDLQHPCTKAPCPHNKITRTFDHFKEHHYMKTRWVCTQERSCEAAAGRDKAMAGLLFYINGRNDDRATIEMMQPVLTIHNVTEVSSPACDKMFTVCLHLPTGYHDNPPRPVDTQVYISEPVEELELFSLHFNNPRVGSLPRDLYVSQLAHSVTAEIDSMTERFDVRCEKDMIAELLFMTTDEEWHELAFFRKVPTQLLPQTDSQADDVHYDVQYDACQNDACFLHEKVRDWDGFTEFRFNIGKWVCMKTTGCETGNPRDVFLALTSYFGGKNVAGRVLGNMMAPVVMQYKNISKDEDPFPGSCHEELEACAPLPRYYQRKNAPAPTEEGLMLRQVVTPSMYIISLKGHITSAQLSLELETLKHKLQETGLQFDKSGNLFYTYDEPFTEVDRRVTYTGFWKLQTVG